MIGAKVTLRGIKARPELNGQRGVIVKFVVESGQYHVQLGNGQELKVNAKDAENFGFVGN